MHPQSTDSCSANAAQEQLGIQYQLAMLILLQALQSSMAEGGSALAGMQRLVEERAQQAQAAQHQLLQLQQDQAHLTARLRQAQDEADARSIAAVKHNNCHDNSVAITMTT